MTEEIKAILDEALAKIGVLVDNKYPDHDGLGLMCSWNVGDATHTIDTDD